MQDETTVIYFLGFGAAYIRDFTVVYFVITVILSKCILASHFSLFSESNKQSNKFETMYTKLTCSCYLQYIIGRTPTAGAPFTDMV